MTNKFDAELFKKVEILNQNSKLICFVSGNNLQRLKSLLNKMNIEIIKEFDFINSFLIKADKKKIFELSNFASVRKISSISKASALTYLSKQVLKLDNISLGNTNIGCCVIDTGIYPHLDFFLGRKAIAEFVDFVNEKKVPYDDNGHGTFVSGVLCGNGAESGGKYSGFASGINLFSLKVLDKNGEAYSDKILDAMSWIYDNHKKKNIKVACMSFGSEPLGYADPIMKGAEALWKEGVIVVSAAGNSGPEYQTIKSPGVSPKIITVGGLNDFRMNDTFDEKMFEIADFSSRGPAFNKVKPDVIASAVNITSCAVGGGYTLSSGTSVATPMIAGALCLLCQKYPNLTPDNAKKILQNISKPISLNRQANGFGLPDLSKIFD